MRCSLACDYYAKMPFHRRDPVASIIANLCRRKWNGSGILGPVIEGSVPRMIEITSIFQVVLSRRWNAVLDIEDLQTFVEVADAGGVSAAARRLGVSKSIVSRRLFRLESELGVQLLARTTRGAALTEAGVTFRDHAAKVCAELDIARETILPAGDLHGRLRIAAPLSFGPTYLAPVLAKLAKRHPLLHVHASYSDRFVDIVGGGFDAAVRVGYLTRFKLDCAPCRTHSRQVCRQSELHQGARSAGNTR